MSIECVQRAGVEPNRVQIEITETAIFDDAIAPPTPLQTASDGLPHRALTIWHGLFEPLQYPQFALRSLKIDRSFIDGMGASGERVSIVHSIIHLRRARGWGDAEVSRPSPSRRCASPARRTAGYLFSAPGRSDIAPRCPRRFMVDPSVGEA